MNIYSLCWVISGKKSQIVMDFINDYKILFTSFVGLGIGYILLRRYLAGGVCVSKKRLDDKTVIITGCNTGIGLETAKDLAARGARVIMACRDMTRACEAAKKVKAFSGNDDVHVELLDLASLESVRQFSSRIIAKEKRVDILINNAGVILGLMKCPQLKSKDGYEMHFAVNHLGHFLLTNLLLDLIKKSAPARIINVSALLHKKGKIHFDDINLDKAYNPITAYAQSKLANVLFTKELSDRLRELSRHVTGKLLAWLLTPIVAPFFKTPLEGAQTTLHCALDEDLDDLSGAYFSDCVPEKPAKSVFESDDAKRLWKLSEEMVAKSGK